MESGFREREHAEILLSVPGHGPVLAAEFLASEAGTMNRLESVDRLAGVAGLAAPVPRDSAKVRGTSTGQTL